MKEYKRKNMGDVGKELDLIDLSVVKNRETIKEIKNTLDPISKEFPKIQKECESHTSIVTECQTIVNEMKTEVTDITENVSGIESELNDVIINENMTTIDGSKTFISKKGYIKDISIQGRTLINLGEIKSKSFNTSTNDAIRTRFVVQYNHEFNERITNGIFTIFNYTDKTIKCPYFLKNGEWGTGINIPAYSSIVVTLDSDTSIPGVDFWLRDGWVKEDIDKINTTMVSIIEDDIQEYIPYFKDICSIGQEDKISLISKNGVTKIKECTPDEFEIGDLNTDTGELVSHTTRIRSKNFIGIDDCDFIKIVIEGENINIPLTGSIVALYDSNNRFISGHNGLEVLFSKHIACNKNILYIKTNNASYIKMRVRDMYYRVLTQDDINSLKISIYRVDNIDKQEIMTTLRSVNDISDEINDIEKITRCKQTAFIGKENWVLAKTSNDVISFTLDMTDIRYNNQSSSLKSNIVSTQFKSVPPSERGENKEFITNASFSNNVNQVFIAINKSKLETPDINGFKKWLSDNKLEVVYELECPLHDEIPYYNPQTFNKHTTVILNNGIVNNEMSFSTTNTLREEIDISKMIISNNMSRVKKSITKHDKVLVIFDDTLEEGVYKVSGETKGTFPKNYGILKVYNYNQYSKIFEFTSMGGDHAYIQSYYRVISKSPHYIDFGWRQLSTEPSRIWEGSLSSINLDIPLSDSIYNYKYLIFNIGTVAGGRNSSYTIYPFAYLKNNIRIEEEFFIPVPIKGVIHHLYFKPSNQGNTLYYELRDCNNVKLTSNPDNSLLVIRYIAGGK